MNRFAWLALVGVSGCAVLRGEACVCPVQAHGAVVEGQCMCLEPVPVDPDPAFVHEFFVEPGAQVGGDGSANAPWDEVDWAAVDIAVAEGPTVLRFGTASGDASAPAAFDDPIFVLRTDPGPHRLVLSGRAGDAADGTARRARVPGIRTPFEGGPYSHITVRGFEVTGSDNKGVYWRAGDEVILEDLVVHDNKGSPAINLDYSNRSGHQSSRFVVRNSHVYNHPGEGVYIGGSEGEDQDSHQRVEIVRNLIHDCRSPYDTKHDGINVKDRIGDVLVEGNVVFRTDWGIEVASPGRYAHNIVFDTDREGFQVSDAFGPIERMTFEDNVVVRAGHDGLHLTADRQRAGDMVVRRLTVFEARQAAVLVGGELGADLLIEDVVSVGSATGLDGWGAGGGEVSGCSVSQNDDDVDRAFDEARCDSFDAPALGDLAGPDGLFLTADDGYYLPGRGAQPPP